MSILLALDASSSACSVALLRRRAGADDELLSRFELAPREHTRRLLPLVDEVLAEAGLAPASLDAVAYGHGPGSFTGLRIAAGAAQGLAYGLDRPLIGVSTLAALALGGHRRHHFRYLVTALDARMGEIYVAAWQCRDGLPEPLAEEAVMPPARLRLPAGHADHDWVGIGSGWGLWDAMPAEVQAGIGQHLPDLEADAADMVLLAARAFEAGEARPPHEVQPVYLRDQVAWKKAR
ncbi:tRNA (adenosine(37)-N6)-threonylcarbamoyltransferase complex dimerization subunit type 1 TsaB [Halomonas heilongjiangensis]|uniref:tRNA threonylcarbamoyladenosine biosynthesis protein TsaB n=1 Tax=Halomonas heilongjiangensis TaxID=1387883 RepID=A0A2N7TPF4_9GAMM|nr:tRNA (adenosine(37)-N6)-threonylcarbamoyltransferase complex dimerization subunit type 1 TsaB [Halomonas heilongjiangensis]PMR70066.1 tRNA (adenosine(37)-N6)-threonylcarbamoyltransferase complex dimerization subunit type 1 TsaB [Halomonas heilongjiangensis]PXX94430.1 tRNA (adenosine(37)-N6)-threonylcarbamoyltransferase complex dimerization subunit type 1 TsaB [Halomonas heilongjiangensis]